MRFGTESGLAACQYLLTTASAVCGRVFLPDLPGESVSPVGENDLTKIRVALTAAALVAATFGSTGTALAWGCIAVSENGTYGYSYNFDSEGDATQRALDECATRATTDQTCEITECDPDS